MILIYSKKRVGELKHTYSELGLKTIRVTGKCHGFTFKDGGRSTVQIKDILQWGDGLQLEGNEGS